MNVNTKASENDTFTIPVEVLDGSTGELKETVEFTFTREEIREALQKVKDKDYCPFFDVGVAR
mgnify:CR=1 FL=1